MGFLLKKHPKEGLPDKNDRMVSYFSRQHCMCFTHCDYLKQTCLCILKASDQTSVSKPNLQKGKRKLDLYNIETKGTYDKEKVKLIIHGAYFAARTWTLKKFGSNVTAFIQSSSASLILPRDIRVAARLLWHNIKARRQLLDVSYSDTQFSPCV